MNPVEIWLSILVRKMLQRRNFQSQDELKRKVLTFIEYYNLTMARPFQWTKVSRRQPNQSEIYAKMY